MTYTVTLETVSAIPMIASRRSVRIPEIASAWKPALDEVWAFLREHPELKPGHNIFLYHHPTQPDQPMDIDFGVEAAGPFTAPGGLLSTATPAGLVATTTLVGPYSGMSAAHNAVHIWCAENGKQIGAASWEIYGDWTEDETKLETKIVYLLR